MEDRELVLRFLAFFVAPFPPIVTDTLDYFLHEAMQKINDLTIEERQKLSDAFIRSMKLAKAIFADDAFRKRIASTAPRNPLNKALFDTWSVALARLSEEQGKTLVLKRESLIKGFSRLCNEKSFNEAVSIGTSDQKKITLRFEKIQSLLNETIEL